MMVASIGLLLLLVAANGLCLGASVPELFISELYDAHTVSVASTEVLQSRLAGVKVVQGAAAGTDRPAVRAVQINKSLLASQTPELQLTLPNTDRPIIINIRKDLSGVIAPEDPTIAAVRQQATTAAGKLDTVHPSTWVGEVAGSPGPLSTVTITTAASGAVYGNIRYYDKQAGKTRTFQVLPETASDHSDSISPAVAAFSSSSGITPQLAAALFPKVNTKRHIVVEYVEATRPRTFVKPPTDGQTRSAAANTESSIPKTVDTTPRTPVPADPSRIPLQPSVQSVHATEVAKQITHRTATIDTATTAAAAADTSATGGRHLLQTDTVQDVLIVYTAAAAAAAGGVEAMVIKAEQNIARTNQAYLESGISLTVRLVGVRLVQGWAEDGRTGNFLTDLVEGKVPNVHSWRDELNADLVTLFHANEGTGYCGVAFLLGSRGSASLAYSEVANGCFDGFTFTHELGHNQGCAHHAEDLDGIIVYGYGWRRCDLGTGSFRTIMAYWCEGVDTAEVALFSNPRISINGVLAGDASRGDCARYITESASAVAKFRGANIDPPINGQNLVAIRNLDSNKCLDAPSYDNDEQVVVWDCNESSNQQWELDPDGALKALGALPEHKCLDVDWSSGTAPVDGKRVVVNGCSWDNNQLWFQDPMNRIHPYAAPNSCLDISEGVTSNGNALHLRECQLDNDNQIFEAPHIPAGINPGGKGIKSRLNNMCIDVAGRRFRNASPVYMRPCSSRINQQWFAFTDAGLRVGADKNFCLNASADSKGADVHMWTCHGGDNQKWFIDAKERLRPYSDPSKCLDIRGGNRRTGARLQLWDCLDVPQQKWYVN